MPVNDDPADGNSGDDTSVTAAAERLHAAIDTHLEAVRRRRGDDDPGVSAAYEQLGAAAAAYDAALFEAYDEVLPWESTVAGAVTEHFAQTPAVVDLTGGPGAGDRLTVWTRTDFVLHESRSLLATAQGALAEADLASESDRAEVAVYALIAAAGPVHGGLDDIPGVEPTLSWTEISRVPRTLDEEPGFHERDPDDIAAFTDAGRERLFTASELYRY